MFLSRTGGAGTSSGSFHLRWAVQRVAQEIDLQSILDAGCGKGGLSFWLARRYPSATIAACDSSPQDIAYCRAAQARTKARNVRFFVQDLRALRGERAFDLVLCYHVLEHIAENRAVLSNLVSCLRPGGYIYVQTPNAEETRFAWSQALLQPYEERMQAEHIGQTFTLAHLSRELEALGCRIETAEHLQGFWGELRFVLAETALGYLNSRPLFLLLYPILRTLGYVDAITRHKTGNVLSVLARYVPAANGATGSLPTRTPY